MAEMDKNVHIQKNKKQKTCFKKLIFTNISPDYNYQKCIHFQNEPFKC